jgi:hypothetical protein
MPKVVLPLGSAEAYGAMGNDFIFQGTSVRSYAKPTDPKTGAQLDQRAFFRDVSKMIGEGGIYMRGACRSVIGVRWYTALYGLTAARWSADDAGWSALSAGVRADLNADAPYQATTGEPGRVWYSVMQAMRNTSIRFYDIEVFYPADAAVWLEWYQRGINDVLGVGSYENATGIVEMSPGFGTVTDASASGGSYLQKNTTTPETALCVFWGKQARIIYRAAPDQGDCAWYQNSDVQNILPMYAAVETFGEQFVTPLKVEGLHFISFNARYYAGAWTKFNIDRIDIL